MSADNGIYILESKDEYRVTHAQAIENIYWWNTENKDSSKWERRNEINPRELIHYFRNCKVFKTEEEAFEEAKRIYDEIMKDDFCPIVEYGISYIRGWENKEFPKEV